MTKYIHLFIISFCISSGLIAQYNVFYVGHSLVNHNMPRMVSEIAKSKGFTTHIYKEQIINGSPLKNSWNNSQNGENSINFKTDYNNNFNVLVITEAVPLDNHLQWNQTQLYAHNFCKTAENTNPNSQCYIYETWHCINSGTTGCSFDAGGDINWRIRLDTYLSKWESIADSVEKRGMNKSVLVIPAGQAMAMLFDSIEAGKIDGYTSISQFFSDDIHLNDLGNYYVACVQFATIFKQSPVGAISNVKNQYDVSYNIPHTNTALMKKLQEMAWNVVCNYYKSDVNCSVLTSISNPYLKVNNISPNPAQNSLYINSSSDKYIILNLAGQELTKGKVVDNKIYIGNLNSGLYIIILGNQSFKFIKE